MGPIIYFYILEDNLNAPQNLSKPYHLFTYRKFSTQILFIMYFLFIKGIQYIFIF